MPNHPRPVAGLIARPRRSALVAGLGAAVAACAPLGAPVPPPALGGYREPGRARQGGTYKPAIAAGPVTLHPYKHTDTPSRNQTDLLYAKGLWRHDPRSLDPIPNLAERWEVSADKLTYAWHLRQDIRWSDGKPLTSADWLWTFQQAANRVNSYPYVSTDIEPIAEVTAPEPYRLVVRLKEALVPGIEQANIPCPLPKHIWERYDWNDPAKNPEINAPTVVSGPFRLKEWRRDDHVIYEANDLYWRGRPLLDAIQYRIVPDQNVSFHMLKTGEVDLGSLQPSDFEEAKANPALRLYQWERPAPSWDYIAVNLRRPALQDVRVRRAIAYAVNREAISRVIYNNLSKPTYSVYPPSHWVYNPDVPMYDHDPRKAAAELEAAGWRLPAGAKVRVRDGQPLRLQLLYGPNVSKVREQISVIAQQALAEVGVEVTVRGMEWGAFLQAIRSEPFDYDLFVSSWLPEYDPHWNGELWMEKNIPALNRPGYVNKEVEELYQQGAREFDKEKRKRIYQEIQRLISTDLPFIFLVYNTNWAFLNKRLHVNEPGPLGIDYEIEKWWVEDGR